MVVFLARCKLNYLLNAKKTLGRPQWGVGMPSSLSMKKISRPSQKQSQGSVKLNA